MVRMSEKRFSSEYSDRTIVIKIDSTNSHYQLVSSAHFFAFRVFLLIFYLFHRHLLLLIISQCCDSAGWIICCWNNNKWLGASSQTLREEPPLSAGKYSSTAKMSECNLSLLLRDKQHSRHTLASRFGASSAVTAVVYKLEYIYSRKVNVINICCLH